MKNNRFLDRPIRYLFALALVFSVFLLNRSPPGTLDARFYYTGDQARAFLAGLRPELVESYFRNELVDLCFIATYSALFFRAWSKVSTKSLLPLIPGLFDTIETLSILYVLKVPGDHLLLNGLGAITCLKWGSGGVLAIAFALKLRIKEPEPSAAGEG